VLRLELVDNIDPALAADYLIIWAYLFDTGTHFHAGPWLLSAMLAALQWKLLTFAIGDSSLSKIVRGQLDRNAVARDYPDEVLPHLAGDVSYNLVAVLEFYTKLSPRKGLDDGSCELDYFLVGGHRYNKA